MVIFHSYVCLPEGNYGDFQKWGSCIVTGKIQIGETSHPGRNSPHCLVHERLAGLWEFNALRTSSYINRWVQPQFHNLPVGNLGTTLMMT